MTALDKKELRRSARERRAALPGEERAAASARACANLLEQLWSHGGGPIALFLAKGDEIDTSLAIEGVAKKGISVLLPRVIGRGRPLDFHAYRRGDPLLPSGFGVLEPAPIAPKLRPAVVVVPLLAFDSTCHRLGYGAGYYDMTLAESRRGGPVAAIGFAFACQQVGDVPREPHDEPVDMVVTESGVVHPRPSRAA